MREDGWARPLGAMLYKVVLDTGTVLVLVFGLLPHFMQRGQLGSSLLLALAAVLSRVLYLVGYNAVLGKYHGAWTLTYLIGGIIAHSKSYGILAVSKTKLRPPTSSPNIWPRPRPLPR